MELWLIYRRTGTTGNIQLFKSFLQFWQQWGTPCAESLHTGFLKCNSKWHIETKMFYFHATSSVMSVKLSLVLTCLNPIKKRGNNWPVLQNWHSNKKKTCSHFCTYTVTQWWQELWVSNSFHIYLPVVNFFQGWCEGCVKCQSLQHFLLSVEISKSEQFSNTVQCFCVLTGRNSWCSFSQWWAPT